MCMHNRQLSKQLARSLREEMDQLSEEVIQAIVNRILKKMEMGINQKQSSPNMDSPARETCDRSEASGGGSGISYMYCMEPEPDLHKFVILPGLEIATYTPGRSLLHDLYCRGGAETTCNDE